MHVSEGHVLINGVSRDRLSIHDRGLLYGDGVFRTLRVLDGHPQHWSRHYLKLQKDCTAVGLICPDQALLSEEIKSLIQRQPNGIAKIIITRGEQAIRGYAPHKDTVSTRIISLSPPATFPGSHRSHGVSLRVCDLRLAHQPRLAGIKHLNRLENVLAAAEWCDPSIAEGLLLDVTGNVIECTRSNLFMVCDGALLTPDLSLCGVAGVQRERVIEWAAEHGVPCCVKQFGLAELLVADEVFLVNSVIGLWPVRELPGRTWGPHPISAAVLQWLSHASD